MKLTAVQKKALDEVRLMAPGDVYALKGYAGTGKTVTAASIIDAFVGEKRKVLVAAPTAAALAVLRGKLRTSPWLDFKTLASVLTHPEQYIEGSRTGESMRMYLGADSLGKTVKTLQGVGIDTAGVFTCRLGGYTKPVESVSNEEMHKLKGVVVDTQALTERANAKFGVASPFGEFSDGTEFVLHSPQSVAETLTDYALVVVDEYSMVPEDQSSTLIAAVKLAAKAVPKGPRMLCVGDPAQLQPVDGAMATPMASSVYRETELHDILRSTDDVAHIAQAMRIGESLRVLPGVDQGGVVTVEHGATAVDAYERNRETCDAANVILTFTNRDVSALNKLFRHNLGRGVELEAGDEIVCTSNAGYVKGGVPEYVNGELLTVTKVCDDDDIARFLGGVVSRVSQSDASLLSRSLQSGAVRLIEMKPHDESATSLKRAFVTPTLNSRLNGELKRFRDAANFNFEVVGVDFITADYAYAMTVHKSQGSEWENVVYIVSDRDLAIQKSWHPPYTAITRAKKKIDVIWTKD